MSAVDEFLSRYRKEFDFYHEAGHLCGQLLESRLQASGVRSIVTSRAKSVSRLGDKLRQRIVDEDYQSADDIYKDIVDLAGVRVALYFPGQRSEVESHVHHVFMNIERRDFPDDAFKPKYQKRFSGYWATHYRGQIRESLLNDAQKRYAEANIEIQVASVLMHAWSEVEHDLVYKPLQGTLSEEEFSVLVPPARSSPRVCRSWIHAQGSLRPLGIKKVRNRSHRHGRAEGTATSPGAFGP